MHGERIKTWLGVFLQYRFCHLT